MRRNLIGLYLVLGAALCSWSMAPASAADFYILHISDDYTALLLDPTTITAAQDGHRAFDLAEISEFDLWSDNNMEIDCAGARMRKLSSVMHQGGGSTLQGLSSPGDWEGLAEGSVGISIHDVVCQWPNNKPTGDSVWVAPDFETAKSTISNRLYDVQHEKN